MAQAIAGIYSIGLGLSVAGLWLVILVSGDIPEGRIELGFHLVSEAIMALICAVSGAGLVAGRRRARPWNIAGHAMVLYSVLNAAGYYGERGAPGIAAAMLFLFLLSAAVIAWHLRADPATAR